MIAINNQTQVAEFAYCTELLSDRLIGRGYVSYGANSSTHTLIDAPVPSPWIGGGYDWDGNVLTLNQYGQDNLPQPDPTARLADITAAVQARLDNWAKERFYDGIMSLCTYATSSVPKFAAEGQRGVDNRDATWAQCYAIMADYTNGQRPLPTVDEVLSELPPLDWLVV